VVLFWQPAEAIKAGDHKDYSYTIDFFMNDANRPPLAYCKQTLINVPAPPPAPPPLSPTELLAPKPATPGATPPKAAATLAGKPGTPAAHELIGPPMPKPIPVGTTSVEFLVDFAGDGIENIPANQPPDLDITYDPPGTYLRDKTVEKNGYDNTWRVTFTIIPFKHFTPTVLTCRLLRDHRPISETWNYTWRQ
jgi:glucan biosynthesis protein